jgi:hypothetical protein
MPSQTIHSLPTPTPRAAAEGCEQDLRRLVVAGRQLAARSSSSLAHPSTGGVTLDELLMVVEAAGRTR